MGPLPVPPPGVDPPLQVGCALAPVPIPHRRSPGGGSGIRKSRGKLWYLHQARFRTGDGPIPPFPIIGNIEGNPRLDRREFLKAGALAAVAGAIPAPVRSAFGRLLPPDRTLSIFNTHTGESLDVVYCLGGRYRPEALGKIDRILRDHRTGEVRPIDPRLLDLLHDLSGKLRARSPFHIVSGYRSPETNARLRRISPNVAGKSLHMEGKAVDFRLPGCGTAQLRSAAMELGRGGVGYYPGPAFVHVDVGRVRFW